MRFFSINKILFIIFFVIYITVGWYLAFHLHIYHNDAVSRTANAFFTIFGRNPHIAAIGFVWQPLPSLLEIPFLEIFRPWGLQMLSGPLITAILGALSVSIVYKISSLIGQRKNSFWAFMLAVLFGLNPMILLYAAIGSSETIFIASLLLYSYFFVKWFLHAHQFDLVLAGFFLATAFGSRYESLPVFAAGVLTLILINIVRKSSFSKIEGTLIQFSLPFIYTVLLWIGANWLIKGNPFYFLNSAYSNGSFTETIKQNASLMEYSYHSIGNSFLYALKRIVLLAPGLILLPLIVLKPLRQNTEKMNDLLLFLSLLFPYISILIFHMYQLYKGDSLGWLRFFIYSIVAVTFLAIYFVKKQFPLTFLIVPLLLVGFITGFFAMGNPTYGKEENSFVRKIMNPQVTLDYSRTYADQKALASFMDAKKGKILIDTDEGFAVPLFAQNLTQYVITSDIDFLKIVKNFQKSVTWVIIPEPTPDNVRQNIIYQYYPKIWNGKVPSTQVYAQIDGWRIFKVGKGIKPITQPVKKTPVVVTACMYAAQVGDSLWKIAKSQTGSGLNYTKIIDLNASTSALPHIIHPRQVLIIPCQ